MGRVSNFIVVLVNTLLLIVGLVSLAFGVVFTVQGDTHCEKVMTKPALILGGFVAAVALLGLIGSLCKSNFFMFIYLTILFLLIVGLIGFTIFVFLITNPGAGKVVSNRGFNEHRTWDFSNWLHKHFLNDKNWNQIKSCLHDANVCGTSGKSNGFHYHSFVFFKKTLPTVQDGCCKPPSACGFESKNATVWEAPNATGPAIQDPDCQTWSNNQLELCYDCNSCKGGVLANFKKEWRSLAIINIVILLCLIFVYSIGCCARRSNKSNKTYIRGFA